MQVTISEAKEVMHVSADTIRRRIRDKSLPAKKIHGLWMVELPDQARGPAPEVETLKAVIKTLQEQLEARTREVSELHTLLLQAQKALPAPAAGVSWWRRIFGPRTLNQQQ